MNRPYRLTTHQTARPNRHPLIGFAPVSTLFKLAIFVGCGIILARLAFVWSLGETEKLTTYAIGEEFGRNAAWLIQLLPQVLLIIRVLITGRWYRAGLLGAALAINLVDAGTNIAAFLASDRVATAELAEFPFMQNVAIATGITLAFAITWAEELIAWMLGAGLHMLGMLMPKTPRWMRVGEQLAKGAGFGLGASLEAAEPEPVPSRPASTGNGISQPVRPTIDGIPLGRRPMRMHDNQNSRQHYN